MIFFNFFSCLTVQNKLDFTEKCMERETHEKVQEILCSNPESKNIWLDQKYNQAERIQKKYFEIPAVLYKRFRLLNKEIPLFSLNPMMERYRATHVSNTFFISVDTVFLCFPKLLNTQREVKIN